MNFYAKTPDTKRTPACPHCGAKNLTRQVSLFATSKRGNQKESEDSDFPLDEAKMEKAIESLASEAETINEDDPRESARVMKKFVEATGLELGEGMKTALQRMEAGEDPEKIEEEMGDILEQEDPFVLPEKKTQSASSPRKSRKKEMPRYDSTLYEL
jgi:hypothetical protein